MDFLPKFVPVFVQNVSWDFPREISGFEQELLLRHLLKFFPAIYLGVAEVFVRFLPIFSRSFYRDYPGIVHKEFLKIFQEVFWYKLQQNNKLLKQFWENFRKVLRECANEVTRRVNQIESQLIRVKISHPDIRFRLLSSHSILFAEWAQLDNRTSNSFCSSVPDAQTMNSDIFSISVDQCYNFICFGCW